MAQIGVSGLSFCYDGSSEPIFEDVSFNIDTDWKLGFIGRNGKGKTTFFNLLMGKYEYTGRITAPCDFAYFPFKVPDESAVAAEVIGQIYPDYEPWRLAMEMSGLDLDEAVLERPFNELSNGERTKLLLAALFMGEDRFLLIDEPTNHLDADARETVSRYLNKKRGFILISHDRAFLDGCIDHVLSINNTNIEIQKGNYSSWQYNKDCRDTFELNQNERLKKDIGRLSEAAARSAGWSDKTESSKKGKTSAGLRPDTGFIGHKAAKMMKRSKSLENRREAAVTEKAALLKELDNTPPLKLSQPVFPKSQLLQADKLTVDYTGTPVCENISFTIERGDRIALCGKNGSGKSSILKLILGEDIPHTGNIYKDNRLIISYARQDASDLSGSLTDFAAKRGIDQSLFMSILRKLDFKRSQFERDIATFSDGQKKKVLLSASLCEKSHLLIWDEPLNFIDLPSRMQIEQLLADSDITILFVEHDRVFCENVATKVVELDG